MVQKLLIDVSPGFCIIWAVLLLLLPLEWIAAAVTAAFVHECAHYITLRILGVSVFGITLGASGAMIETDGMSPVQELISALAGPAGSILMLMFIRWIPQVSLCAGIQGLYNLLPVFPFDGGRALKSLLEICCPGISNSVMNGVRIAVCGGFLIMGVKCLRYGVFPLMISLLLLWKVLPRKRPCKEGLKRVQ